MLARRPDGINYDPNTAVDRFPGPDAAPFPSSPLERNPLSPKGWKKRDSEGVGLGIVAKLDGPTGGDGARRGMFLVCSGTAPIVAGVSRADAGCCGKPLEADGGDFPVADFLRCCSLCRNVLDGKDIYMYRGEKGFCSEECRKQQITNDECLEKLGSEVFRRAEVSNSPCSGDGAGDKVGRLFFAGIAAA